MYKIHASPDLILQSNLIFPIIPIIPIIPNFAPNPPYYITIILIVSSDKDISPNTIIAPDKDSALILIIAPDRATIQPLL